MRIFIALLAISVCAPAMAQDSTLQLPDLVVTATRNPTSARVIPAGITVIDRATIEARGYNTLADALTAVPGLRLSPAGGPGGQTSVFVRGTNSNHVLVLRDGMPITDAAEATGAFNFGVDTLADVERIEIVRGPMAALYGSGAIGGVINLISRQGRKEGPHWTADLAGGYPLQLRASAGASGVVGPIDYALTAETQSQRGYDSTPQRQSVHSGRPQGYRDRIATINLGYTPVDGTRLSLFFRGREALFGFNALGSPTYDTANSSGTAASMLGRIGFTSKLFDGAYETSLFLGRLQEDRRYKQPLDVLDPNLASSDARYHSYRTDLQWNNTLRLDNYLPAGALTFGLQHTVDSVKLRTQSDTAGFGFSQGVSASTVGDAAHAGLQTTLWDRLTLTAQVRHDWVADKSPTTWRLGGVYDLREIGTHLKLAYGTAFRAPSLFDRFGVDSFGYRGNRALKPETAAGWEAGFTTDLSDRATIGATYFNQQVTNLITTVFTPVYTSVNIGSAHVQGVEFETTLRPAPWLTLHAAYSFTDTLALGRAPAIGSRLLRRPQHAFSADATLTPLPKLRIVPEITFAGAARDFLYDNTSNGVGYGTGQQGLIANLTVTYDVEPSVRLYAVGRNVFYSRYEQVNGYQIPGPVVIAGVKLAL